MASVLQKSPVSATNYRAKSGCGWLFQQLFQILSREALRAGGDLLRRAAGDDLPAAGAALRSEIDDIVRDLDDIKIVLDDEHGIARVDQPLQDLDQLVHVRHVQARRRLVEDIERAARRSSGKLRCELDALRLAAGERRGALAELDIAEAHVDERGDLIADARQIVEEGQRLLRRHVKDIRDVLALVQNLERFAVVPLAAADLAGDENVGQKVHLDLHKAVAAARLAAAAFRVEREPARAVAPRARVGRRREQVADVVKYARIRRRIGAWHTPDGALVDADDLVQMLQPLDAVKFPRTGAGTVEAACKLFIENFIDEARLAGAGHAGHARKRAEREFHVDVAQVIFRRAEDLQAFPIALPARFGQGDLLCAGQILACDGARGGNDIVDCARGDDLAAVHACAGTNVDDEIGGAHGVLVVLDDKNGVADVAQTAEGVEQLVVIPLVQADGRLVEDIQNADEARADLRGQPDTLAFAAGKRGGRARKRQIAQAHRLQKRQPGANFAHDLLRDHGHGAGQLQIVDEFQLL